MRVICLCLLTVALVAADNLTPDKLYGHWVIDDKALTKEQKNTAAAAAKVENFGINLTLRTARVAFSNDSFVAGMWRLDDATPTTAILVIQPKGADEQRFHLTLQKSTLIVDECPGKMPLKNARATGEPSK
jgi:hypothetical protein